MYRGLSCTRGTSAFFCLFFAHNARKIFSKELTSACADALSACGHGALGVLFGGVDPTALSRNNRETWLSALALSAGARGSAARSR